ncbi:hypothetical protein [Nitrosospira multiformis]|uniref:hypothetical protein n=1 Tax=Nitrosospira multiformis TaxID=1231 RepID=UPI0015A0FD14
MFSLCLGQFPPVQRGREMEAGAEVMGEVITVVEVTTVGVIMAGVGTTIMGE